MDSLSLQSTVGHRGWGKKPLVNVFLPDKQRKKKKRDCSIIYNLHIQLKHWLRGSAGKGRRKNTTRKTCKHPEADSTEYQAYWVVGFYWRKGEGVRVSVQVRADGVEQRYKSKAEWDRKDFLSCGGELLSTPPRGGDPSRHDRQHHGFFSSCFFSIFFQVLSGSASSLGGLGATTLLLLSSFHLQNPLCSFNKAAAGGVPRTDLKENFFC